MYKKHPKIKMTAGDVLFFLALTGSMLAIVGMLGYVLKEIGGIN